MSIQSSINQGLSVMSMLLTQSPKAEGRRAASVEEKLEKVRLKNAQAFLDKTDKMGEAGAREIETAVEEQSEKFRKSNPGKEPTIEQKRQWAEGHAKAQTYLAEQSEAAARELFIADPTEKTYAMYARNATGVQEVEADKKKYFEKLDKEMADKAQEAKLREQKRLANNLYMINRRGTNNGK